MNLVKIHPLGRSDEAYLNPEYIQFIFHSSQDKDFPNIGNKFYVQMEFGDFEITKEDYDLLKLFAKNSKEEKK